MNSVGYCRSGRPDVCGARLLLGHGELFDQLQLVVYPADTPSPAPGRGLEQTIRDPGVEAAVDPEQDQVQQEPGQDPRSGQPVRRN